MYKRSLYLERIRPFLGKMVVKVVTGMRRVGKSYLLRQIMEQLRQEDVADTRILYIDKESLEFEHIANYRDLNQIALAAFAGQTAPCFLFVDEIQEIEEWERAVASLSGRGDIDILISGSNAHLLSSEIATLLSGRYVEFPVYGLGFREHLFFREKGECDSEAEFAHYLRYGGMPATYHFDHKEDVVYQYISSVFNTILLKDIVKRHAVRNVPLLENIGRYLFDNIGNIMSAKRIADYLKSQNLRIGVDTVQNYLMYFTDSLMAQNFQLYEIKGKRLLEIHEKYYLNEIGMRHAVLGYRDADIGGILENVVFLELRRRGYRVTVGKIGEREIDFIAVRENEKLYVQVTYLLASQEIVEREFGALLAIPDNYPKVVLSMDKFFERDRDGIRHLNLIDFLLEKE